MSTLPNGGPRNLAAEYRDLTSRLYHAKAIYARTDSEYFGTGQKLEECYDILAFKWGDEIGIRSTGRSENVLDHVDSMRNDLQQEIRVGLEELSKAMEDIELTLGIIDQTSDGVTIPGGAVYKRLEYVVTRLTNTGDQIAHFRRAQSHSNTFPHARSNSYTPQTPPATSSGTPPPQYVSSVRHTPHSSESGSILGLGGSTIQTPIQSHSQVRRDSPVGAGSPGIKIERTQLSYVTSTNSQPSYYSPVPTPPEPGPQYSHATHSYTYTPGQSQVHTPTMTSASLSPSTPASTLLQSRSVPPSTEDSKAAPNPWTLPMHPSMESPPAPPSLPAMEPQVIHAGPRHDLGLTNLAQYGQRPDSKPSLWQPNPSGRPPSPASGQ